MAVTDQLPIVFPPRTEDYLKQRRLVFETPFRLEIAAGERPTPGFLHNDMRDLEDIEIVCDCRELPKRIATKAVEIRCTHALEHFSHRETVSVLREWGSLMELEGFLHIEVPNLLGQIRALMSGELSHKEVVTLMYGDQDYEGNQHLTGFTHETLAESLWIAGFRSITIQDIGLVLVVGSVWQDEYDPNPDQVVYSST